MNKHSVLEEPRDCVLYIIARILDENICIIDKGKSVHIEVNNVDVLKYLYIGITNNFERRMTQHLLRALNPEYMASAKFYNRIKSHGWNAYEKRILVSGLTRTEAKKTEVDMIAKYRTFELGLNSTPGGDGGPMLFGDMHPCAQAVNVYNNKTGYIKSFLWMRAADDELGVSYGTVSSVANQKEAHVQTWSPNWNTYVQVHYTYDETPFEKNMQTPNEKRTGADNGLAQAVELYNCKTGVITSFSWLGAAAKFLGYETTDGRLVGRVASPTVDTTQIQSLITGEWFQAHYKYDKSLFQENMLTPHEKCEKGVVAYDEDDQLVYRFDSAKKAATATRIAESSIRSCAKHELGIAGKIGNSKLSWEYEDPKRRAKYDLLFPRKPKKPFYYIENGVNIDFRTIRIAAENTCGTICAVKTQEMAISASIKFKNKTKPCKAGHIWFKL
jgi:hypothetical protein